MSLESERCLGCGRGDPDVRVDCVSFTLRYDTRARVNGAEVFRTRGAVRSEPVTACACADCARRAVERRARASALKYAAGGFVLTLMAALFAWSLFRPTSAEGILWGPLLAAAVLAGAVLGFLRFRRVSALPPEFGAAFLLDTADPACFSHLPRERALYPGADEAAKKKAFIAFDAFPGSDGTALAERLWEKNTR